MKAALITEEQIKAIEDALERAYDLRLTVPIAEQAIAIVKSLKVSEPIAWLGLSSKERFKQIHLNIKKSNLDQCEWVKPLYALGDEK